MFFRKSSLSTSDSLRSHYPVTYKHLWRYPVQVHVEEHQIHIIAHLKFSNKFLTPYINKVDKGQTPGHDPFLTKKPEGFTFADAVCEGIIKNWGRKYDFDWYSYEGRHVFPVKVTIIRHDEVISGKCEQEVSPKQRYVRVQPSPFFMPSSFVMSYPWRWLWGIPFNLSPESIALNWSPKHPGVINLKRYYSLRRFEQVAAHEFGHVLGIGDAYDAHYRFFYQAPEVTSYMMCYNNTVNPIELEMVLKAHLRKRMQYFPFKFNLKRYLKGWVEYFK